MRNRKALLSVAVIVTVVSVLNLSWRDDGNQRSTAGKVGEWYTKEMQQFDKLLEAYPQYFYGSSYATRIAKYEELITQFKKIEGLFTYLHPKLAYETFILPAQFEKRDFGPPVPDNWIFLGPFGLEPDSVLQKFTTRDSVMFVKVIARSVSNLRKALAGINTVADAKALTDVDVFEALRLQMMRISTIGIANADFVVDEAAKAGLSGQLAGWSTIMKMVLAELPTNMNGYKKEVVEKIVAGEKMLEQANNTPLGMKHFDRLEFLTRYLIPLAGHLSEIQHTLKIEPKASFAAVRQDAKNIYAGNVFNADYFAPGKEAYYSKAKATLGQFLFFDPILSDNNERACASCHKPELAFTDGNVKSLSFVKDDLPRNAPTVINSAFQTNQFWDLRATSLEDQLDSVINSADEMHSSFEDVLLKINSSPEYQQLFYAAFPDTKNTGIERKHVKIAIASYERELVGFNSRFDQYLQGDKSKMNEAEKNGFNLFMGKARCGNCHYAPLFNSSLPPYFDITDHKSIGVPLKDTMEIYQVDADTGASKHFKNPLFHFSFKTPTVRNAALTAPYMHNGVFKTLAQVVDFYDGAGGMNFVSQMRPGMKGLPFFMILPEKLKLNEQEKAELVAFMEALTDNASAAKVPTRLPTLTGRYAGLSKRKIGGVF